MLKLWAKRDETTYVKTIGLYNGKAKNIIALSKILVEKFGGKIPRTREELQSLPGVGRKTANVVLNVVYGEPTMAVDTHVFRVSNRTGLAKGKTPEEVEDKLMKVVPKKWLEHAHHWLILHGRYTCKARVPALSLYALCVIFARLRTRRMFLNYQSPNKKRRPESLNRRFLIFYPLKDLSRSCVARLRHAGSSTCVSVIVCHRSYELRRALEAWGAPGCRCAACAPPPVT